MFAKCVAQTPMLPSRYCSESDHICEVPEVSAGEERSIIEAQR